VRVVVRLHGEVYGAAARLPDRLELTLPEGATVAAARGHLGLEAEGVWLCAVNGALVDADHPLQDGDCVEFLAPVSGG